MHLYRHSCLGSGFSKASGQDGRHAFQLAADIVSAHVGKVGDTGCHSQRVAAQSAGLIHGANRSNLFHDLAFTAVSGYRQPAADIKHIKSETMLAHLAQQQVYVSSASACGRGQPSHTLAAMGRDPLAIDTAIRVSFCADNTPEDVDAFLNAFEDGMKHLQRIRR